MTGQSIRILDLDKGFRTTQVLRGVSLDIRQGEFLTLLGASGCGKSTLLRLIAGFEPPDAGRIMIGGCDVSGLPPKARDVAMVFQSYALYPHMTVRENIAVPLEMRRLSALERQPGLRHLLPRARHRRAMIAEEVKAVAAQLDLGHLLDRRPAELSGGQRQRVAVGRAMVRQPAAFLMDEPLSNLDARLRIQLREEITELHRRTGITVIYVTHDQTEAMAMSDRVAVMEAGQVSQIDTPEMIYNAPATLSVARFVGTAALNEIAAEITGGRLRIGGTALGGTGRSLPAPGLADGPCLLAIRPERLRLVPAGSSGADFRLPVERVEFTGAEVAVRCDGRAIGTTSLRAQARAEDMGGLAGSLCSGAQIGLCIAPGAAMLFDQLGRRLPMTVSRQPVQGQAHDLHA